MRDQKKCIFHYPNPVVEIPGIGSALRPRRMLEAFRSIGYEVEEITGYSAERKQKIRAIREKIRNGERYEFVYSESVNDPCAMTDRDHVPRHPFMDFAFFRFCRAHGIPVGLFYRDMHWRFPFYRDEVSWWKRMILIPMFQRDLREYRRSLKRIYYASPGVDAYLKLGIPFGTLPPGGERRPAALAKREKHIPVHGRLHVLYVGSVSGAVYDMCELCGAVKDTPQVWLTICTQQKQWEEQREKYAPYLCERIQVVQGSGAELKPLYEKADVFACCFKSGAYTDLAMPIKVPEAISYGVPVLITETMAAADMIRQEQCGWLTADSRAALAQAFVYLRDHPEEVAAKTKNTVEAAARHTWECRARQVAEDLTNLRKE
ncbi:MAG: glycosyltransferase family 4 protein [Oscillospiraceae bacterium]|nr:glycosyltransferase family 4 protein [Oscillospiraceae bacterium]